MGPIFSFLNGMCRCFSVFHVPCNLTACAEDGALHISNVQQSDVGEYYCTAENRAGQQQRRTALTVSGALSSPHHFTPYSSFMVKSDKMQTYILILPKYIQGVCVSLCVSGMLSLCLCIQYIMKFVMCYDNLNDLNLTHMHTHNTFGVIFHNPPILAYAQVSFPC